MLINQDYDSGDLLDLNYINFKTNILPSFYNLSRKFNGNLSVSSLESFIGVLLDNISFLECNFNTFFPDSKKVIDSIKKLRNNYQSILINKSEFLKESSDQEFLVKSFPSLLEIVNESCRSADKLYNKILQVTRNYEVEDKRLSDDNEGALGDFVLNHLYV